LAKAWVIGTKEESPDANPMGSEIGFELSAGRRSAIGNVAIYYKTQHGQRFRTQRIYSGGSGVVARLYVSCASPLANANGQCYGIFCSIDDCVKC